MTLTSYSADQFAPNMSTLAGAGPVLISHISISGCPVSAVINTLLRPRHKLTPASPPATVWRDMVHSHVADYTYLIYVFCVAETNSPVAAKYCPHH